jgi:COMMD1 N-terminal domain
MSFESDLDEKYVTALFTGLSKRRFFGDQDISDELLHSQIFGASEMSAADIANYINSCDKVLSQAAQDALTVSQLQEHLSQVRVSVSSPFVVPPVSSPCALN